jgi:hypothetical protein
MLACLVSERFASVAREDSQLDSDVRVSEQRTFWTGRTNGCSVGFFRQHLLLQAEIVI